MKKLKNLFESLEEKTTFFSRLIAFTFQFNMDSRVKFFICAFGIFIFFFLFGILQERITRGSYGEEKFTYSTALVFCFCVFNYIYATIMSKIVMDQGNDSTPNLYYAGCAFTYSVAMVASNKALQWVNYPTQVIAKSCKPIPVMILGVLFGGKKYPLLKYLFVFLIVAGVALFTYKDKGGSSGTSIGLGEFLLLVSLTCDGLTGAIQERMKAEHKTKSNHMMTNMNMWSVLILGIALLATGELFEFLAFVKRHPDIIWQLLTVCGAMSLGQHFIFMCISEFGPLPCSIITTTRKCFTVLASVIFFGNSLSGQQWIGAALVFTGLFLDSTYGKSKKT